MDDSVRDTVDDDLTAQVAELRAVNAELGRALAAADAGTPLRSSITTAHLLSRAEDAERSATAARAERDVAVAARDQASGELEEFRRLATEHAAEREAEHDAEALRLSQDLAHQVRATELALSERDEALTMLARASAELDAARAKLAHASSQLDAARMMLSRRSVRTAQRAAKAVAPVVDATRRVRRRAGSD